MMPFILSNLQIAPRSTALTWLPTKGTKLFNALDRLEESYYSDIYQLGAKVVFAMHRPLSRLHDGVLQTYLVWVVVAMIVLFLLK